jgi:transcriptional antiterminator RfaH
VYLSRVPNRGRKQGQVTTNLKAVFPGYLFVEVDSANQDLSVIRSKLGCISLLRRGLQPAIVPERVIVSAKEAECLFYENFEASRGYAPGKKYELLGHGFHGHTATFLALDRKGRARVLVSLLNSLNKIEVPTISLGPQLS